MTQATDSDIRDLRDLITRLDNKIDKLDAKIDNLDTKLSGKIDTLEAQINGRIDKLEAQVNGKFDKLDERTKLGFWGFILRGVVLALILGAGGYLLPIVAEYVHKLPSL